MMTRWLVVAVCSLGLAAGCDDDSGPGGTGGKGGAGGSADAAAGSGGTGTGGSTGGTAGTGTGGSTGGAAGTGTGGAGGAGGSGTDGGGTDAGGDTASAMASMMITASAGGTLSAGGGSLVVPAGVLSADKMLTVTVRAASDADPGRANILGDVYEFGPDGTTFAVPVALTLPLSATVAADKKPVVAWLDAGSGQWFPVASTVNGDKVTGLITHFTRFALLQIPRDAFCAYGGACGGSLDGTWSYTQSCLKPQESEVLKCGDLGTVTLRTQYNIGGTVTIGSARFTATQNIQAVGTLFYNPPCMTVLRDAMPGATCATLQQAWRDESRKNGKPEQPWICLGTPEQGCSCSLTNMLSQTVMGSVAVAGTKVTFTQDGKTADAPDDFCVKGNTLSVQTAEGDVYTAVKQ
jgi:hypothetical protein